MSLETELETEIKRQLQEGIGLARAGNKLAAAEIFGRVLKVNPDYEDALVWKAAVCDNPSEAVRCLQRALKLNPQNRRAQAGLEWALKQAQVSGSKFQVSSSKFQGENSGLEVENLSFGSPPAQPEIGNLKPETLSGSAPSELEPRNLKPVPLALKLKSKDETKSEPPPYKKSRLANPAPDLVLPPEALPRKTPLSPPKAKSRFWLRPASSKNSQLDQAVKKATSPKIALRVAQNVTIGEQSDYHSRQKPDGLMAIWPLGLFVLALALALLTFLFSSFAPVLGVIALIMAVTGIILFDRAEF